ncbi:MAG: DUF362 domain-containing protein [Deltaproteobacteria bacterium]|nr:DUF362 domain-containing protein [Deltaproteobacteria bacterium]MBT4088994.1 DUF362 domain-containing protein [Deltaproteobacteria bacterium]MBT4269369.1 DUF362 domain-containing protein [Deltaproteobacteria bacterium]MBT4638694.1 DUF362 domain-containing protein [Deltaproteobacteria bacterium]MBT6498978.1 DUF362 domain-containing protein [Deltaproteobacteria bacterium]
MSRRTFLLKSGEFVCLSALLGCERIVQANVEKVQEFEIFPVNYIPNQILFSGQKPVVSVVKVNSKWSEAKGVEYATTKAIDLIGGINEVTKGKERILLKPNLVNATPSDTTNPRVIEALARLMKNSGKEVVIGEAGAASMRNIDTSIQGYVCRTKNAETLQGIQNDIFKGTGYDDISKNSGVPLINLHVGNMVKMKVPDNFVFKDIYVHKAMYDADLVCSVPMMKTHGLATVTLALKNIGIGGYPGMMYGTVRSLVHQEGIKLEPTGTSSVTVDMVKANKLGLSVIDATTAMQGQGPSVSQGGSLVEMNLIIASKNALAADMVAANIMGFEPTEIDTFKWAWKAGMSPSTIDDIDVVGEKVGTVQQQFTRPQVYPYTVLTKWYGPPCRQKAGV